MWERELYKPLWEVIKVQTYKHYRDDWNVRKQARQSLSEYNYLPDKTAIIAWPQRLPKNKKKS